MTNTRGLTVDVDAEPASPVRDANSATPRETTVYAYVTHTYHDEQLNRDVHVASLIDGYTEISVTGENRDADVEFCADGKSYRMRIRDYYLVRADSVTIPASMGVVVSRGATNRVPQCVYLRYTAFVTYETAVEARSHSRAVRRCVKTLHSVRHSAERMQCKRDHGFTAWYADVTCRLVDTHLLHRRQSI